MNPLQLVKLYRRASRVSGLMQEATVTSLSGNDVTWEYLAGFFDGEGCIHYQHREYGKYVLVNVTQGTVNEAKSHVLRKIFVFLRSHGIPVRWNPYTNMNPYTKNYSGGIKVVATNAPSVIAWLEGMLPHLIVKRDLAIEAVAFARTIHKRAIERRVKDAAAA